MRIVSRVGIGKNPTSHHLDITGSVNIDSQTFIQGNVFLNSNVDLGNTSSDLVALNGRITTSIIPNSDQAYDFGSSSLFWRNCYFKNIVIQSSGSIESQQNILNLGINSNSVINIGSPTSTVNVFGVLNKIESTDLEIKDKLITLNKNGTSASALNSGFEIEENSIITGYIKTSSDRNKWILKSPGKNGTISLEPSFSFDHTIVSNATADRVWLLPDNSDTFVGTTNDQQINNKTLNDTIMSGTFTITGTAIGVGFIPIGGVIATMPHIPNSYNCTATTTADSYGFVRCGFNGQVGNQVINDLTSPLHGQTIPRINNDVFLMGNVSSGVAGGSNAASITSAIMPSHQHNIDHNHDATGTSGFNARHNHGADDSHPRRVANTNHNHGYDDKWQRAEGGSGFQGSGFSSNSGGSGYVETQGRTIDITHDHDITVNWQQWADGGDLAHAHTGYTPIRYQNTGSAGSGSSFDSRPSYISTVYIMRIK